MPSQTVFESDLHTAKSSCLVSVIMPAYNVERYLMQAVQSILNQTHKNLELIIVDDCSLDSTLELAHACAKEDARVKVIANSANQGAAVARNLALDAASGDWVAIVDSDDWLSSQRLEVLLQKAEESSADLMADDFGYVNDGEKLPRTTFVERNGDVYSKGLTQIETMFYVDSKHWTVSPGILKPLVRRSFIEEQCIRYKDEIRLGQDFFFYLDCLIRGARFFIYPEVHYYYRVRSSSVTNLSKVKHANYRIKGLTQVLASDQLLGEPELYRALLNKRNNFQMWRETLSVRDRLRNKRYLSAMAMAARNPGVLVRLTEGLQKHVQGMDLRRAS